MDFNLQPTLQNELVLVRPLKKEDFEELYQVANDPKIWEQHQNSDRWQSAIFKKFFDDAMASKGAFAIIDKETNRIIGSSRYKIPENSNNAVEIGWTFLSRNYWGGKYNKSFKTLMIGHALSFFKQVVFYVNKNNFRSQKAVEKLGGPLIYDKDQLKKLRHPQKDTLIYSITKDNWVIS